LRLDIAPYEIISPPIFILPEDDKPETEATGTVVAVALIPAVKVVCDLLKPN